MSKEFKLFSKIQIEVFPPNVVRTKGKDKDVQLNKDGKITRVAPQWNNQSGKKKRSVEFKKDRNVLVTEEQYNWITIQDLIKSEKVIVVEGLTKKEEKIVNKEVIDELKAQCDKLEITYRKNATEESLRKLIEDNK